MRRRVKGGGQCGEETEGCCKQEQAEQKEDCERLGFSRSEGDCDGTNGHHDASKQKL